ncbi:MAG: hypothetical protein M0C28_47420 [Candidatus Moduliflexus flocculans]|nr:hypothetical protein [Candidatus Moduliflexus flocculans]
MNWGESPLSSRRMWMAMLSPQSSRVMGSPLYGALSETLKKFKENLPDIKYIYLMKKEGSSVVFVVDPDEENPAAIGEEYLDPTLRMLEGFERTAVDDDLTTDEWECRPLGIQPCAGPGRQYRRYSRG